MKVQRLIALLSIAVPLGAFAIAGCNGAQVGAESAPAPARAAEEAAARTTRQANFARYLIAPDGRAMGMMLSDGSVVLAKLSDGAPDLKKGDALEVEGTTKSHGGAPVIFHATVKQNGTVIASGGGPRGEKGEHKRGEWKKDHEKEQGLAALTKTGSIVAVLGGHEGRVFAIVLDDGTTAMLGHRSAPDLALAVGQRVTVSGKGTVTAKGTGLKVASITLPNGQTRDLHGEKKGREQAL